MSDANVSQSIPDPAKRLIERHIRSVGELEILLLTRRTKERTWAPEDASRALRTSSASASLQLAELAQKGFLSEAPDGYRYVARGQLDAAVADVEQAYARFRTRIVRMIFEYARGILTEGCAKLERAASLFARRRGTLSIWESPSASCSSPQAQSWSGR